MGNTDNRAELILSLRDEISSGMAKVNAAVGEGRQGIGGLGSEAKGASVNLASCQAAAQDLGTTVRRALEFAGVTVGLAAVAYKVKEFTGEVMDMGARTEMLRGSAYAVGQYYQVSGQAIDYYVGKLQDANITEQNAFYGVTKFLAGGLNLELIPALAAAAKNLAPLAPEGKTVNEEFKGLITTIASGMPRGLKEFGIQMGNVLGDAGRSLKSLDDEMSMTSVERAQATLTYVLSYAEKVKYVGEETANTYARQRAKLGVETERAKEALFDIFKPIGEAVTGEKIQAWQDLYGVIVRNKIALVASGEALGVYIGRIASAVGTVLVFAGTHKELLTGLLELATLYKVASWVAPYITGTTAAAVANTNLAAAQTTAAATSALAATAQAAAGVSAAAAAPPVLYLANAYGAVTGTVTLATPALAGAGAAAASSGTMAASAIAGWTGLAGSIKLAVIALAAYGAYQTIKKPADWGGASPEEKQLAGEAFGLSAGEHRAQQSDFQGYEAPMSSQQEGFQLKKELTVEERLAEINAAVKKALADAKANQPKGDKSGKGGAGEEASQNRLENFIQTLRQQAAQAAGDSMKAVDAWESKELIALSQIEEQTGKSEEARTALKAAAASKRGKIEENYNLLIAKESGNGYAEIEAQAKKWVNDYQGIKGAEQQIAEITSRKKWELDVKNYTERLTLEKSFYDQAAQLTTDLNVQVGLKRQSLDLEIKLGDYALATKLAQLQAAKQVTAAEADQYRGAQALLDQAKRYKFEMENDQGVAGWAYERGKAGQEQFTAKNFLTGAESFLDNALTQGIQGALSKTQTDWMAVGKTMAQSMVLNLGKAGLKEGVTQAAKALTPEAPQGEAGGIAGALGRIMGVKGPTGAANSPFYVVSMGGAGKGVSGLFGGGGIGGAGGYPEVNEVTGMWNGITNRFKGVFDQGSSELNISSTAWNSMFQGSNTGLLGTSTDFSGMFDTSVTGLLGASDGFGGVFSGFLSGISGLFGGGGGGGGGDIFGTSILPFFLHDGGPVIPAVYAHTGLNLKDDERLIIGQTGEGMLSRRGMGKLPGGWFDDLNQGNFEVVPPPPPRANGRRSWFNGGPEGDAGTVNNYDNKQAIFHVSIGDIHAYDMTQQEAERFVDRKIIPAINKKLGNRGLSLLE